MATKQNRNAFSRKKMLNTPNKLFHRFRVAANASLSLRRGQLSPQQIPSRARRGRWPRRRRARAGRSWRPPRTLTCSPPSPPRARPPRSPPCRRSLAPCRRRSGAPSSHLDSVRRLDDTASALPAQTGRLKVDPSLALSTSEICATSRSAATRGSSPLLKAEQRARAATVQQRLGFVVGRAPQVSMPSLASGCDVADAAWLAPTVPS